MLPHIISVDDLYPLMLKQICDIAVDLKAVRRGKISYDWSNFTTRLRGCLMISDFFEPSTRTRLSFEAAMAYLGGSVIGTENAAEFSSFAKGESLEDNFRVISGYGDIIVARFKNEGEARKASLACTVPLINGGDGTGEHPTQALIDYFTIREEFDDLETGEINIVFMGDNKRSRTVQSLAKLLAPLPAIKKITFVQHNMLKPETSFIKDINRRANREICETVSCLGGVIVPDVWETAQIVYMTRSQDERGGEVPGGGLVFLPQYLEKMPERSIIMHPLPRNSELPTEIDRDPRARYFQQAHNGLYVRMALLDWLFGRRNCW
jgi:aspartate carbamoyltransferase catalytic subunit